MSAKIHIEDNSSSYYPWIRPEQLKKPGWRYKISYYWIGITNNQDHKFKYLEFRASLDILQKKGIAMYEDLYVAIKTEETKIVDYDNEIKDDIIEIFKLLDKYLLKYHKLLWCTKAPIKKFIISYFQNRNKICEINTLNHFSTKIERKLSNREIAQLKLYNMNLVVSELDVMSEFIKSSVDTNDQLPFKIFLLILNILSVMGQYIWNNYSTTSLCETINT